MYTNNECKLVKTTFCAKTDSYYCTRYSRTCHLFVGVRLQLKVFRTKGELKTITQKRHKARAEGVYSAFLEVQYSAPIKSPIGGRGGEGWR